MSISPRLFIDLQEGPALIKRAREVRSREVDFSDDNAICVTLGAARAYIEMLAGQLERAHDELRAQLEEAA